MTPAVRLWLDSGAFSVWRARQNGKNIEQIRLPDYVGYIRSVEHLVECYITLDDMPLRRTGDELVRSARVSYERHQHMRRAGLRPMPVFHQGEPFSWLEQYICDGEDVIGLSGLKGMSTTESVRRWCDVIFTHCTDCKGRPLVKFHGLGITQPELLRRYPWFSVDSTSWTKKGGYGMIFVPEFLEDAPDYTKPPKIVAVSGVNKNRRQFEHMSDPQAVLVLRWLDHIGTNVIRLRNLPDERRWAVLKFYEGLRQTLHDVRFQHKLPNSIPLQVPSDLGPLEPWTLRIVYATNTMRTWCCMMTETGCMDRLLSYAELRDSQPNTLEDYVWLRGKFAERPEYTPPQGKWRAAHKNWRAMALHARLQAYEAAP